MSISIRRAIRWAPLALALMMLALTATPAEVWKAPIDDVTYKGFDPNFIYANAGPGSVQMSTGSIDMAAVPGSQPSLTLATTFLQKMNAAVDVSISDNSATEPLRIGVWSPWTASGQFLVFGPAPQNLITAETLINGSLGPSLVGGDPIASTVVGHYQTGRAYRVTVRIDKPNRVITTSVSADDGTQGQGSLDATHSAGLLDNIQLTFAASSFAQSGTSHVRFQNYSLTLPHQRAWASKMADDRATGLLVALVVLGLFAAAIAVVIRLRAGGVSQPKPQSRHASVRSAIASRKRALGFVVVAIGVYLVANALLFPVGGHPFDFGNEKLYAYVARVYGVAQLYYVPNVVSLAGAWAGLPYVESAFPYEPVVAYLFTAIGWLNSLFFSGGGVFALSSHSLDYLIKGVNVLFGLADAALIYLILRQIGTSGRWSLIPAGLFLFNPAVWFSMSIWGQTHVMSIFFVLAVVLLAEKGHPTWAWLALAAGCLTRPQMLVFGLVLGIVLLRKFHWQQSLLALSWTVILTFLALAPLTLATSPSLPVDIMVHNLGVQAGGGNVGTLTTVSQDAYSLWPLVTYFAHGTGGLYRAFTPSSNLLVGSLTYQRLGQILTLGALLVVCGMLVVRKRAGDDNGAYLPLVALGITSFLMLLTGVVATHFLLALPFLLLCRRWMGGVAYLYIAAIWTITTFVPMYGDMGNSISQLDYPLLGPAHNQITRFFIWLYSWDRFITVGVVANVCALIWLGSIALRRTTLPGPPSQGEREFGLAT